MVKEFNIIEQLVWKNLTPEERSQAISRSAGSDADVTENVKAIVDNVHLNGNEAVADYAKKYDGYEGSLEPIPEKKIKAAAEILTPNLRKAMEIAIANITAFHTAQKPDSIKIETTPGIICEKVWRPIEKVGLYIPGGTAPLFSTVIMTAIPAQIAGCQERILCTPPQKDGTVNQEILAAAYLCGITKVFAVGGPWSIAAMAYGTKTIPKVDKIIGPGNSYVTAAKMIVSQNANGAAIDMPAGPSEVMVIADENANPSWVAADMLAQMEHGPDSQALLLTESATLITAVANEIEKQTAKLDRSTMIKHSLKLSRLIQVKDIEEAISIANCHAPEHLIIQSNEGATWPERIVDKITGAASVFIGPFSPETAGDYASGTNHVLPTYGHARAHSGLNLLSFMKSMTVQTLSRKGLKNISSSLIEMAKAEGLDAHANAVKVRLEQ